MAVTYPSRARTRRGGPANGAGGCGKRAISRGGCFGASPSRRGYTLLDRRLYLPEQWCSPAYRARWQAAAIPPQTTFATKPALAAALVEGILASGTLRARWLTCDEGFGDDP